MILTRASRDEKCVEVVSASIQSGGNVQQWGPTNHACQNWKANVIEEEVTLNLNPVKINVYKDNKDKDCIHTVVFVK